MVSTVIERKEYIVRDKWELRGEWEAFKRFSLFLFIASLLTAIISPILSPGFLLLSLYVFYHRIYKEVFAERTKRAIYNRMFQPKMDLSFAVAVGYEVPLQNLDEHISHLQAVSSKDEIKKAEAEKYLERWERLSKTSKRYMQVGFSKNQMVTHFWVLGTTGAGKTSFIMTLFKNIASWGGGAIFVDGKGDTKMVYQLYNILSSIGREHDLLVVNFLETSDSNTFNPLASMDAFQILEFLSTLMGQEISGDQKYWQGRGKAMLKPIIYFLDFRRRFYNEKFTLSVIYNYASDVQKYTMMSGVILALCYALEERLKNSSAIQTIFKKAKASKGMLDTDFPYLDALVYYFTVFPHERIILDRLGFDFEFMRKLLELKNITISYVKEIFHGWFNVVKNIAQLYLDEFGLDVINKSIDELQNLYTQKVEEELSQSNKQPKYYIDTSKYADAFQQHSYGQQQWSETFSSILLFEDIFGSLQPEVDLLDAIKNNKFVYFVLPPLKQSPETTELLGKLILTAMRTAISFSLGGKIHGLTKEERDIYKAKITPFPMGLLVLDEYGAYPIKGLDVFLAQVRSINISTIVATQDITSARAGGQDENSLKRTFANTQKILMRLLDKEAFDFFSYVFTGKVASTSYIVDRFSSYTFKKPDVSLQEAKVYDEKILTAFRNGLAMVLTDDQPVIVKFYYENPPEAKIVYLNKSFRFN